MGKAAEGVPRAVSNGSGSRSMPGGASFLGVPPRRLLPARVLTVSLPLVSSQRYLRDFFSVMLQSATSPLHIDKVGLTLSKHTVCEFSPFFKKGVFDYSSHGTG